MERDSETLSLGLGPPRCLFYFWVVDLLPERSRHRVLCLGLSLRPEVLCVNLVFKKGPGERGLLLLHKMSLSVRLKYGSEFPFRFKSWSRSLVRKRSKLLVVFYTK